MCGVLHDVALYAVRMIRVFLCVAGGFFKKNWG